nr:hypothetical protein [Tanacetum cinerariifolium]
LSSFSNQDSITTTTQTNIWAAVRTPEIS